MKIVFRYLMTVSMLSVFATMGCESAVDWKKNETNSSESQAMITTRNGFGAQIWLIDDERFFDEWEKPTPGIEIKPVTHASRDKPIFAVIIFSGAAEDSNGLCNVTGDIIVLRPDGTTYGDLTNANFWQRLPPPKAGQMQLGVEYLGIRIEKKDPSGKYAVKATVIDKITGTSVTLATDFLVD